MVTVMSTVDRVLPWRRHHETAASAELTPLLAVYRRRHPKARVDMINRAYHMAAEAHRSQTRSSGESYINHPLAVATIVADIGLDDISVAAALLHDAVEDTEITLPDVDTNFGAEVARLVDGVTKLERIQFDSREAQQAATMRKMLVRDGEGPPGARHQARRPPPQHAHARRDAAREAAADRPGDARHLRPAGAPARHPGDQAAARGPLVRGAAPQALRRARPPRRHADARARDVPRAGGGRDPRPPEGTRDRGRGDRPRQAPVEHLREDGRQGPRVRRHLRHRRGARDRRLDQGLLRRARQHPRSLASSGGSLQGLHRDAEVQPLPEPAHDGDRAVGPADRGPDPHPRDAPAGGVGGRRALGVQGRRQRQPTSTGSTASSTGRQRSATRRSSWRT